MTEAEIKSLLAEIKNLDSQASSSQRLSAHTNALDTTKSIESLEYLQSYAGTLRMILD